MSYGRREFLVGAAGVVAAAGSQDSSAGSASQGAATGRAEDDQEEVTEAAPAGMFGLVGCFYAVPGQRDVLVSILLEGTDGMPGCLSYIVATDPKDPDAIWITEAWDSPESHKASLSLPQVRAAIAKAKPLIARMGEGHVTRPVGGIGLKPA